MLLPWRFPLLLSPPPRWAHDNLYLRRHTRRPRLARPASDTDAERNALYVSPVPALRHLQPVVAAARGRIAPPASRER